MAQDYSPLLKKIADLFTVNSAKLCVVESCTGGALGAALTSISGSSGWFHGGFITYSNEAKMKHVYVRESTLSEHGAVSEDCVKEMANGGMISMDTNCCVSISGIAGPDGGTDSKPVGTVWIGLAVRHQSITAIECHFEGDRDSIRQQAVYKALEMLAGVTLKKGR